MLAVAAALLGANILAGAAFAPATELRVDSLVVQAQADGELDRQAPLGVLDPEVEASMPVCAAVAADETTGALGNGDENTQAEAIESAMNECRSGGGTNCRITSVACDPTRSSN